MGDRPDTPATVALNTTSLRCRPLEETLAYARRYAEQLGISRVTDITRLDRVGIPIYSSIRPGALAGSLCVNSGKGLRREEAEAGAYMEAIEFAMAEPNRAGLDIFGVTPRDLLDGHRRPEAVLDFCPVLGRDIPLEAQLAAVAADDLVGNRQLPAPAELAFFPFPTTSIAYFGSHTNGLCSGNSRAEAQIHGLLEVLERDIMSFQTIRPTYQRVDPESFPPTLLPLVKQVRAAGLELIVKYGPNAFGLPFFTATVIDHQAEDPLYINGGLGCHSVKSIALNRAIAEALQSRLTFIHGGRDDLIRDYTRHAGISFTERRRRFRQACRQVQQNRGTIRFEAIEAPDWPLHSLEGYRQHLLELLVRHGIDYVLSVAFTPADAPLQVLKMIVPKLEFFTRENPRIGPRLRDYATHAVHRSVWRA